MKIYIKSFALLVAITLASSLNLTAGGCGGCSSYCSKSDSKKDIVATAINAGNFETLVAAVKAAGLVETLQGDGPFTVFAPNDDAFAKLSEEEIANLLKPENKQLLTSILTYHVIPAKVMAKDVKSGTAPTVNGQELTIMVSDGNVTVNGANVIATDIKCQNGVIHVIDSVILPPNES